MVRQHQAILEGEPAHRGQDGIDTPLPGSGQPAGPLPVEVPGNSGQTSKEVEEKEEQYEVAYIIDKKRFLNDATGKNEDHFLVRWKGYGSEDDSWEPRSNLGEARESITAYTDASRATKASALGIHAAIVEDASPDVSLSSSAGSSTVRRTSSRLAAIHEQKSTQGAQEGELGDSEGDAQHATAFKVLSAMCGAERRVATEEGRPGTIQDHEEYARPKDPDRAIFYDQVGHQLLAVESSKQVSPGSIPAPTTAAELASHPHRHFYETAAKVKKEALKVRGTLKRLVTRAEVKSLGKKVAKSRMILSWKTDVFYQGGDLGPKGERAKARWIICGYSLVPGLDFDKTASPSADMTSWRIALSGSYDPAGGAPGLPI